MPKNFVAVFTVSGLIIILSMFINIIGYIDCQSNINSYDVHIISAFDG